MGKWLFTEEARVVEPIATNCDAVLAAAQGRVNNPSKARQAARLGRISYGPMVMNRFWLLAMPSTMNSMD